MALLDWWRMGQQDPGSVYNIAPGGTFTTMFGNPQPDPAGQPALPTFAAGQPFAPAFQTATEPPPPVGTPKQPEILTDPDNARTVAPPPAGVPKKPEILTGPRDERTVPPPAAPDPPPTSRKVPEVLTPIAGPDNKPARDERLVPTPATTPAAAAGNDWDRIMKMMKDPKMGPAIAALSKLGGSGKGPAPPAPWRSTMHPGNPGFNAGNPGSASQILQGMTGGAQRREEARLKKMAQRRNERDRYDILAGRG